MKISANKIMSNTSWYKKTAEKGDKKTQNINST